MREGEFEQINAPFFVFVAHISLRPASHPKVHNACMFIGGHAAS